MREREREKVGYIERERQRERQRERGRRGARVREGLEGLMEPGIVLSNWFALRLPRWAVGKDRTGITGFALLCIMLLE